MRKYEVKVMKFSELEGRITIPRFQRSLVWGSKKKQEFIKTLKAGLPIGVLLLWPDGDKFQIVDGLQRFTTMLDYSKDYFKYISPEEITENDLMDIILASSDARETFDNYRHQARVDNYHEMRRIIASHISESYGQNSFSISLEITNALCTKIAALPVSDSTPIHGAVYGLVEKIKKNARIDDVEIPLIIFTGREDELTSIFQKLNQEGVRLSKYDVYAASWQKYIVQIKNDPKFINYIIKKYENAEQDSDLEIDSFDPDDMKKTGILTVFEYAFALGKAMMDECKKLFPRTNESKIDSIGFIVLAELIGLAYTDMGNLAETITQYKNLDFKALKDAIIECTKVVENALGSYIEAPTKSKKTSLVCHSELQLVSYIIVIFKLKYEITHTEGLKAKPSTKILGDVKKYLYHHYLYDILRDYWAGSGDSKLEDIIADPYTCRYTKDVARGEFESVVTTWLNDGNRKIKITNVSAETKLFLNYLLQHSGVYNSSTDYDIEHCVPKAILEKYCLSAQNVVPISSPCNLVYIPKGENRSKGDQTYYQRNANSKTTSLNEYILEQMGYPRQSELEFVEATSTLTPDNYFSFLESRKHTICKKFIDAMYH